MSLIILAGSAFSAGISSFAAQPEIEIMDIDNSNPFDYEHYINEKEEEAPGRGIDIIPNEEKRTKAAALPSAYDSRDYGYVSSVKSQGRTGTCWAHAVMSAVESYEIKNNGADRNINLSEAHLTWFALNPNSGGANKAQDGQNLGTAAYTNGGNWLCASIAFANREGINLDSDYPLTGNVADMAYPETDRYSQTAGITAEDVTLISEADDIKTAIMNNGSVTCSFYSNDTYLTKEYSASGIFASYYCPDPVQVNHAVALVGWDDNYSKDHFKVRVPSSNGAWIAKNSYGDAWGNGSGYFMISYEDGSLSQAASWSVLDTGEFVNNYSHTSAVFASTISNFNTYASVYTADGYEMIDNIGIFNMADDAEVTVSVYKHLSPDGSPESGSCAGSRSRYFKKEGYYTFYFGNIPLDPGERFAVVVSISCPGKVKIPVETAGMGEFTCNANESYLKTGSGWFDLTENAGTKIGNTYVFVNTKCRHNFETLKTPATCLNSGKAEVCCAYCGRIESESVIPATGHHFRTVSSESGDSNEIIYTKICADCGLTRSESYHKGSKTVTFAELIQRIFEMIFGRLKGIKAGRITK